MELVKRYIAAVQRQLPAAEREEIGRELEANILDKLDAIGEQRPLTREDTITVLKQMGHPRKVAAQFVKPHPLVRAEYLPLYRYTMYIVIGILFVLQVVNSTVSWLHAEFGLLLYLKSVLSGLIEDGSFAFTVITLAFILMSRSGAGSSSENADWRPESLPPVGPHWRHISLQDIFNDLATYTFLLIIIWYPQVSNEPEASFFSESALYFLSWCSPVIVAGVALSLWQLSARWWNQPMQIANIAINLMLVAIILYLATSLPVLQEETHLTPRRAALDIDQMITWSLFIVACFPGYEALRDIRRLLHTRAAMTTLSK